MFRVFVGEEPIGKTLRGRKRVVTVIQRAEHGKACGRDLGRAERRNGSVGADVPAVGHA